jgi:hypothetical protein
MLKRSLIIFVACLAILPLQLIFLVDYEHDKAYWCGADHYSSARCHEAEGTVNSTVITSVILTLAMLGSLGLIMDRMLLPPAHDHDAEFETS